MVNFPRRWTILTGVVALVAMGLILLRPAPPSEPPTSSPKVSPPVPGVPARPPEVWRRGDLRVVPAGAFDIRHVAALADRVIAFAVLRPGRDDGPEATSLLGSIDGLMWEPVPGPINDIAITAVTTVDGTVWAFGQAGEADDGPEHQIWTTSDGIVWKRIQGVTGLDFGAGVIYEVAGHQGGMFAMASHRVDVEFSETILLRSDDGHAWERVAPARGPVFGIRSMTAGSAGYVVLFHSEDEGNIGEAWHSPDGRAWTRHPIPSDPLGLNFHDAAFGHDAYVAVGVALSNRAGDTRPAAWLSPDGQRWAMAEIVEPAAGGGIELVASIDLGFIALGRASDPDGTTRVVSWGSPDGRQWHRLGAFPAPDSTSLLDAVAWREFVIVAGSETGQQGRALPVIWVGSPAP